MAYQIKETFYELKPIDPIDGTQPYYIVQACNDQGQPITTVMRGTLEQCQAYLDERPGSAISISDPGI